MDRDIALFDGTTEFHRVPPTNGFGAGTTVQYQGQHPIAIQFTEAGEGLCGFSISVRKITQAVSIPLHRGAFTHCAPFVHRLDVDKNRSILIYARPVRNIIFTHTGEVHRFLVLVYSVCLTKPFRSQ